MQHAVRRVAPKPYSTHITTYVYVATHNAMLWDLGSLKPDSDVLLCYYHSDQLV